MLESLRSSVCRGWCPRPARRKWGGVAKCHGSWASDPEGCRAESEHTEGRGPSLVTSTARDQGHRVPIAAKLRIPGLEDVNGDALKGSMETEARRSCRGRHGEERERARFRVAFWMFRGSRLRGRRTCREVTGTVFEGDQGAAGSWCHESGPERVYRA